MDLKNGKRSLSIEIFDCKLPPPLTTPRIYPVCSSMDYDSETKTVTMVHKPCEHKYFVDKEKHDWRKKKKMPVFLKEKKIKLKQKQNVILC